MLRTDRQTVLNMGWQIHPKSHRNAFFEKNRINKSHQNVEKNRIHYRISKLSKKNLRFFPPKEKFTSCNLLINKRIVYRCYQLLPLMSDRVYHAMMLRCLATNVNQYTFLVIIVINLVLAKKQVFV